MKILITGAKGQVGTDVVIEAKKRKHEVYGFSSSELDITNQQVVDSQLSSVMPDVVINAAAYTAVDKAETEQDKAYAINELGVKNLADTCKKLDIPLLHISTDYVFDGEKKEPYVETDTPNPTSVYGASKLAGEIALQKAWYKHIILRVSWVFGEHGNNFVKTMLRLAQERDEISVVDDQYGAPTPAQGIASEIIKCVQSNQLDYGVFHLQVDPGVTWYEFAQEVFSQSVELGILAKSPVVRSITSNQFPTPVKRPSNSKLASERLGVFSVLDWKLALRSMLTTLS